MLHVHGAYGSDVMDSTPEALACISQALAREGIDSIFSDNHDCWIS